MSIGRLGSLILLILKHSTHEYSIDLVLEFHRYLSSLGVLTIFAGRHQKSKYICTVGYEIQINGTKIRVISEILKLRNDFLSRKW